MVLVIISDGLWPQNSRYRTCCMSNMISPSMIMPIMHYYPNVNDRCYMMLHRPHTRIIISGHLSSVRKWHKITILMAFIVRLLAGFGMHSHATQHHLIGHCFWRLNRQRGIFSTANYRLMFSSGALGLTFGVEIIFRSQDSMWQKMRFKWSIFRTPNGTTATIVNLSIAFSAIFMWKTEEITNFLYKDMFSHFENSLQFQMLQIVNWWTASIKAAKRNRIRKIHVFANLIPLLAMMQ